MRAPFSEMLPVRRGVSILTRGVAAIAASRLTIAARLAGRRGRCRRRAGLRRGAALPAWSPGVACGEGLASSACVWVCARCFSICGTL